MRGVAAASATLGHTRFAANEITTAGMVREPLDHDHQPRRGPERLDHDRRADDVGLARAVARSEALMAAARPDPEAVESARPAAISDDPRVRRAPPPTPARSSGATASRRPSTGPAAERLNASGFFETGARWSAIANKKGNFGFHRSTVRRVFDHDAHRRRDRLGLRPARGSPGCPTSTRPRSPSARREGRVVGKAARPSRRAATP